MPYPEHLDEGTIHGWLDGQLPPDEAAAVESHLAACAACAALVAEARGYVAGASRILGALDGAGSGRREAGGGGAAPVASAPAPQVAPIASRRRARRWMIPSAAAATLVVAIGTTLTMRGVDERVAVESAAVPERAVTGSAEAPATPDAEASRFTMPTPSPSARPAVAPAPSASGSSMGGGAAARARVAAADAMVAPSVPPPAAPAPAQPFAERGRASAKAATTGQTADAVPTPSPAAPGIQLRRQAGAETPIAHADASQRDVRATAVAVTGRVTDPGRAPLPEATISIVELGIGAVSGADGRFAFEIPAGRVSAGDTVRVRARRIGFSADTRVVTIPARDDLTIDLALSPTTMTLDAVAVTGVDATASARSDDAAADWRGCYLLERAVPGLPQRFQLDGAPVPAGSARRVVRAGADVVASWEAVGRDTARLTSIAPPTRSWTLVRSASDDLVLDGRVLRKIGCDR